VKLEDIAGTKRS